MKQKSREALIELLFLSLYLDSDGLTYSEQRFLGQLEARFFPKA